MIYYLSLPTKSKWVLQSNPNIFSTTTSTIPTSNWVILGSVSKASVTVNQGICTTTSTLSMTIARGGNIVTINATGGVSPYQYSKNGGATYVPSPIFTGLFVGTTYVFCVKDSTGTVVTQSILI
jgi:hypothetical protein